MELHSFSRTELLIGRKGLEKLSKKKVAVFGIGGVGTFVVEGLARTGVGNFVLVDDDNICLTNINRQIHALRSTVGKPKVEVMKNRILDINPKANVATYKMLYNAENANKLLDDSYDYVVDAIDMVSSKLDLVEKCYKRNISIISSMGAGNKLDPTKFEVADIYKTSMCPLAKVMRKELRKRGVKRLKVVYSKEKPIKPIYVNNNDNETFIRKKQVPGSIAFVPSVAGLIIASEVIKDLLNS
ncbi:tRNA A37 threonylcarbamoyladenosine dehydratase [Caminicella sporogenes DSM 14501]|uniref:tRNA A37 threonylcarbamoyladenosine dehydratase n=1 Tax=Caminicella sporogenes DSM 14501 TaxID=1121266 RepID=A0A1M6RA11_9FIRM|nr:tRNA threonylcarbamoyladenosine dehydratase [Caminicella sporogenes]RKD27351.1 tRNA cyclic N6-threonylcarbamoyladenosine(37) synthase TcdA [Caminicella sporogenes]SHK29147.1 tRNA A37 threonylcarbamoyladenosine dehydratase [Caminicella sporogenes DSM 14501]